MPRALKTPRHTGPLLLLLLAAAACVLRPGTATATTADITPTLSGLPAWGDGSRCTPLPSDPAAAVSFRFESPEDRELDGIFLRLPASRRRPPRVAVELRNDVGGHPGDDVLGAAEVDLAPARGWTFVSVGQLLLAAGERYHVVLHAAAGSRGKARVCWLWHRDGTAPEEHPWGGLQQAGDVWAPASAGGGWLEPVFVLRFTDGAVWGQPYWTVRSGRRDAIFAHRDLEMRIEPSPVQLTWLSARVKARRPDAVLRYRLMSSRGENIREGVLLPSDVTAPWPTGFGGPIDPPLEPLADRFYVLQVHAPEARSAAEGFRQFRPLTDFPHAPPAALGAAVQQGDGGGAMSVVVRGVKQPRCGNRVVDQPSERCDGRDDAACPGTCQFDCTCGLDYPQRNAARDATVTVSSEDTALGALGRGAVDGVVDGLPGNPAHEWATRGETAGAWITLTWPTPVRINRVVLHDRPSPTDNVTSAVLVLPKREIPIAALPTDGRRADVTFDIETVSSLTVRITGATGVAGLAEIEVVRAYGRRRGGGDDGGSDDGSGEGDDGGGGADPGDRGGGDDGSGSDPGDGAGQDGGGGDEPDDDGGSGRVFYLGPGGNDANAGTARTSPWKTFGRAFNADRPLLPGDTLVLLDGTYTRGTTGLVRIDCSAQGNARNGTSGEPITIRAENERRAALVSDGSQAPFEMRDCAWWRVIGLRAQNADNAAGSQAAGFPFRFSGVRHVTGRRLLGSHNNRMQNTHVYAVENSENVLLEECEAYFFHRHGFSIWRSRGVTLRRCYASSMLYGKRGCCSRIDNRDYGDEAFSLYGTSDSIVENCVSENQANGYQIHGIKSPLDPSGHGGRNNRILGSISLEDAVPSVVSSRADGPNAYYNASGNVFRDFVAVGMSGNGVFFRGGAGNRAESVTLLRSTSNSGLVADGGDKSLGGTCSPSLVCTGTGQPCTSNDQCGTGACTRNPEGCSFSAVNVLAASNAAYGVTSSDNAALVTHSNAAGNSLNWGLSESIADGAGAVRSSLSTMPTKIGLGAGACALWVPRDSNMRGAGENGADVGANVLYRWQGGQPTTRPLWDPATGRFPCGAVVAGINDGPKRCSNLHERLNVNRNGCAFPAGYGG